VDLITESGQRMETYLPFLYRASKVMEAILDAQGAEVDEYRVAVEQIRDAAFVRSTEDWGIQRWEDLLELPPEPTLTLSERQDRVVSHIRGFGTTLKETIALIAEAYVFGAVSVADVNDGTPDYTVEVTFVDERGVPSNLSDLEQAVEEAIPAHLALEFIFTYNTWDEIDAATMTWDDLDALALTWDEFEGLEL
jgi:hypothetical protein